MILGEILISCVPCNDLRISIYLMILGMNSDFHVSHGCFGNFHVFHDLVEISMCFVYVFEITIILGNSIYTGLVTRKCFFGVCNETRLNQHAQLQKLAGIFQSSM